MLLVLSLLVVALSLCLCCNNNTITIVIDNSDVTIMSYSSKRFALTLPQVFDMGFYLLFVQWKRMVSCCFSSERYGFGCNFCFAP